MTSIHNQLKNHLKTSPLGKMGSILPRPLAKMVHRLTRDLANRGNPLKPGDDQRVVEFNELRPAQQELEAIIGGSELLPAYFLVMGALRQNAVARIRLKQPHDGLPAGCGWGTGFLISPSLLITNNHVIATPEFAVHTARIQFNFENDLEGTALPVDEYDLDPDSLFLTSPDTALDYTIVRVHSHENAPGDHWGTIPLTTDIQFAETQQVNIIQHPQGRPKEVVLRQNRITSVLPNFLRYEADTEPGSSGSPVLNNSWQLVALHHAAGDPGPNGTYLNNEGVRIDRIIADIRQRAPNLIQELGL